MQCEREREQKSEYCVCVLVGEREVLISSEHNQKREKIEAVKFNFYSLRHPKSPFIFIRKNCNICTVGDSTSITKRILNTYYVTLVQ